MIHIFSLADPSLPTTLAAFLASLVEFVEALTIVLAVAVVNGWRSALAGSVAGVAVLAVVIAIAGPLLMRVNLNPLRVVAGVALLVFGLRWLRKGVLRAAGKLALHDEDKAFAKEVEVLHGHDQLGGTRFHFGAAGVAFNGVLVEGAEVAFIVLAAGATAGKLWAASFGAALALGVVVVLGLLMRRPITAIPENTLKLAVAVMVCGLGVYWLGEGVGIHWVGGLWASLGLSVGFLIAAIAAVSFLKGRQAAPNQT